MNRDIRTISQWRTILNEYTNGIIVNNNTNDKSSTNDSSSNNITYDSRDNDKVPKMECMM